VKPPPLNPLLAKVLVAPLVVAVVAFLAWLLWSAEVALALVAIGAAAIIGYHVYYLMQLERWAAGPIAGVVPEGRGVWRTVFSAMHRRSRTRTAHERDLVDTLERFRSAADAIPDGMIVLNPGNRIGWANRRAQVHFGFDLGRDTGRPLTNLVRQPEVIRYLEAGDFSDALVFESLRTAGMTLSIQVVPFGIEQRLLMSRDVTRLEQVARMRRDFIANVSHELKTPLTVVSGFLETIEDLALAPAQRERYVRLMREQARSMERLVNDLLTLSALESDENVLAENAFAVMPLLLELSADAKALSSGQHTIAVEMAAPAMVTGSRDELASAFGNLVSNAIRYTPPGGTITLSWERGETGGGVFSVRDTGIGIATEHLPRLTERFYRVDRSRSRATGGTGLGLAIVKHVLLRHQAMLAIASEPGSGSTFTVHLPARRVEWLPPGDTPAESTGTAPAPDSRPSTTQLRSPG
jgi:two-component system phosphate regulon sensor histidine kinase PhoR